MPGCRGAAGVLPGCCWGAAGCCQVRGLPGCRVAGVMPGQYRGAGCRVLPSAAGCCRVLPGAAGCCRVLPGCEDVRALPGAAGCCRCCRVLPGAAGCCRVLPGTAGLPGRCRVVAGLGCRVAGARAQLTTRDSPKSLPQLKREQRRSYVRKSLTHTHTHRKYTREQVSRTQEAPPHRT